jgi:hypothetical protein
MGDHHWTWAKLDEKQVQALQEAERTLGADYVLAYQAGGAADGPALAVPLRAAALNGSQLECLLGLENQLSATLVAYARG